MLKSKGEYIMRKLNLDKHLKKHKRYAQLANNELGHIGCEIQKHIDWNGSISIEDVAGDSLCVSDGNKGLVPLDKVIEIIEEKGALSEHDYNLK